MTPEFLNYIRHLSKQDKKSLTQKALKTVEEVGELAKVVLPYENAYATTHRFTEREAILEESMDTVLCALSVAYDLDFTDEEVFSMLTLKAEKWAKLQANEAEIKYPLPFEIHVTVHYEPTGFLVVQDFLDSFKFICLRNDVKPIVIDLQDKSGNVAMIDVMTSSKHFGTNASAYEEATRIKRALIQAGLTVVRVKIETVPWHPAAPQVEGDKMPPGCYFEAHIPITVQPKYETYLRARVDELEWPTHASRNAFKVLPDGRKIVMLTYRMYDDWAHRFTYNVDNLTSALSNAKYWEIGRVHTEFSVYDTKVSHDDSWINAT